MLAVKYATAVGLDLPENLPFADWRRIGAGLGYARTQLLWAIGDWWNYGWGRYGNRVQEVERWGDGGLSFQACMDLGWVCREFETSRRREVLSFSHHREVAGLEPAEADRLLDWVLQDPTYLRSTRELREEVKRLREEEQLAAARRRLDSKKTSAEESPPAPVFQLVAARQQLAEASSEAPREERSLASRADATVLAYDDRNREDWLALQNALLLIARLKFPHRLAREPNSPMEAVRLIDTASRVLSEVRAAIIRK